MTHPYFCHIHQGLYVYDEDIEGCQHDACVNYRSLDIAPQVIMGIGETHKEFHKKEQHKQFGKDMHAFREARRNGLTADQVSVKSVEQAERRAEIQERLIERAG